MSHKIFIVWIIAAIDIVSPVGLPAKILIGHKLKGLKNNTEIHPTYEIPD